MKQLRVVLLPPGWAASASQGYHCIMSPVPIYTPGLRGERQCGVKFIVLGNNAIAGLGLEPPAFRSEVQRANHYTTPSLRDMQ